MVYRICYLYLKNEQDAYDVTHETFIRLIAGAGVFQPGGGAGVADPGGGQLLPGYAEKLVAEQLERPGSHGGSAAPPAGDGKDAAFPGLRGGAYTAAEIPDADLSALL